MRMTYPQHDRGDHHRGDGKPDHLVQSGASGRRLGHNS
jgi:hypothetical protein